LVLAPARTSDPEILSYGSPTNRVGRSGHGRSRATGDAEDLAVARGAGHRAGHDQAGRLADTPAFAALEREAEEREKEMKQPDTMPKLEGLTTDTSTTSQVVQIVVILVAMVTVPLLGKLSDRIGRKPIAWFGAIGLVVLAFPMILLVRAATPVSIFAGLMVMGFLHAAVAVPHRGARGWALDRVQRVGLAVRGHHVVRGRHPGGGQR
jgi:hypothetical protein